MPTIQSFRDLNAYQKARREAQQIFFLTLDFPKSETYSLTDQIRRSSRAVSAILAEAWARRMYEADFVNKLTIAIGEANETQSWLDHALDCGYLDANRHSELNDAWSHIAAMLQRMINKSADFVPKA